MCQKSHGVPHAPMSLQLMILTDTLVDSGLNTLGSGRHDVKHVWRDIIMQFSQNTVVTLHDNAKSQCPNQSPAFVPDT